MRFNRGTIGLLAILLVVIIAVLVINNQQASAPGETPTAAANTGALLPNVATENIVRYEVRDNNTGSFTAVSKDAGGAWVIDATNALADRVPEQSLIDTTAGQIVAINYSNTFTDTGLSNFGLDSPDFTVFVTTADGQRYVIHIGDKQPTGPRYYAIVAQETAPAATAEATVEAAELPAADATAEATAEATADLNESPRVTLEGEQTIYLIPQTVIDTLKRWLATPPYAPLPTATPTLAPTATPEATAEATAEATPEATAEATAAS